RLDAVDPRGALGVGGEQGRDVLQERHLLGLDEGAGARAGGQGWPPWRSLPGWRACVTGRRWGRGFLPFHGSSVAGAGSAVAGAGSVDAGDGSSVAGAGSVDAGAG